MSARAKEQGWTGTRPAWAPAPGPATTSSDHLHTPDLPSGVPAADLGLTVADGVLTLPAGLVAPEGEEAQRLLVSLPGPPPAPDWWAGHAARRDISLVLSLGAVSLNSQVLPLLQAAEAQRVRGLAVLAPLVTDEALATLLINDLARVFPGGILPLQLLVPEFHTEEVLRATAHILKVPLWDGRPDTVGFARVPRLEAHADRSRLHTRSPSWLRRLLRL